MQVVIQSAREIFQAQAAICAPTADPFFSAYCNAPAPAGTTLSDASHCFAGRNRRSSELQDFVTSLR
jgi:hypothetical protein